MDFGKVWETSLFLKLFLSKCATASSIGRVSAGQGLEYPELVKCEEVERCRLRISGV